MTTIQSILTIGAVTLGTIITRFLPFLIFPSNKKTPDYILYLGKVLPFATTGMIVVYCLKSANVLTFPYMIPEILSIILIVLLHKWKNNMLYSIIGGTICYMVLVQKIFIR